MSKMVEIIGNAVASGADEQFASIDTMTSALSRHAGASVDAGMFRGMLDRHMIANADRPGLRAAPPVEGVTGAQGQSLGDRIVSRATGLATELKVDQQHVSKMMESATRNGDEVLLMKAMMALNDYEMRVQFVSKVVAKTTTGIDQLTRLQ